jgi:hypothetical protein
MVERGLAFRDTMKAAHDLCEKIIYGWTAKTLHYEKGVVVVREIKKEDIVKWPILCLKIWKNIMKYVDEAGNIGQFMNMPVFPMFFHA